MDCPAKAKIYRYWDDQAARRMLSTAIHERLWSLLQLSACESVETGLLPELFGKDSPY